MVTKPPEGIMTQIELKELLSRPSISLHKAAAALGCGKNVIYRMAESGQVPVIEVGQHKRVPTAWIKRQLQLDAA